MAKRLNFEKSNRQRAAGMSQAEVRRQATYHKREMVVHVIPTEELKLRTKQWLQSRNKLKVNLWED